MPRNKKNILKKIKCFFRKWMSAKIIPNMVLNGWRIFFYRLCGYKIGKHVFIGMHCYLDDLEPKMLTIEDNVTISYGVYFACHGKSQEHMPITIKRGAYIGMRASIISKNSGGGYSWRYNRRERNSRSVYPCEQRYSEWCYGSRCTLQDSCEVAV